MFSQNDSYFVLLNEMKRKTRKFNEMLCVLGKYMYSSISWKWDNFWNISVACKNWNIDQFWCRLPDLMDSTKMDLSRFFWTSEKRSLRVNNLKRIANFLKKSRKETLKTSKKFTLNFMNWFPHGDDSIKCNLLLRLDTV